MANAVEKANTIAIASIQAINGITDDNLQALNGLEFTGTLPDSHTLIATATASSSATLAFTSGIDSTYDAYEFRCVNMHPATDGTHFSFQVNATDGADFNDSLITSTYFGAVHGEGDFSNMQYDGAHDLAQQASHQRLINDVDATQAESSQVIVLTLYAPSSTTYVKHFTAVSSGLRDADYAYHNFAAGYINDTTAIDEISFKYESGNIDAGQIKMYGIAKA